MNPSTKSDQRSGDSLNRDRRRFCKRVGIAIGAGLTGATFATRPSAVNAQEPEAVRAGNVLVGLAAYSFKPHFRFFKGKPQKQVVKDPITMRQFIDYCADHHCAAELTSYFFPPDADDNYFRELKRHAFLQGVPIVGTAIGNNFSVDQGEPLRQQIADAKKWIDNAAIMGAPHVRFFAGKGKELQQPETMARAIAALQECCDYAAGKGVFIGVENHGRLTADQVVEIVEGVNSDWFGVNLDSGNFISDDPYADIARCMPMAVNFQLKTDMKRVDDSRYDADMDRIADIVRQSGYRGYVVLEFEQADPRDHVPGLLKRLRKSFT